MSDTEITDERIAKEQGWVTFTTWIYLLAGVLNTLVGIVAFANRDNFAKNDDLLLYKNLTFVGVVMLVIGLVSLLTAYLLWKRSPGGRVLGGFMAVLGAASWFFFIDQRPVWSVVMIVLYVVIMLQLAKAKDVFAFKG
jgi:hypothetical protein